MLLNANSTENRKKMFDTSMHNDDSEVVDTQPSVYKKE